MKYHVTMSLDLAVHEKMKEVAKERNMTVSALITKIFLEHIKSSAEEDK